MDDPTFTPSPSTAPSRPSPLPFRDDCWSEEATSTLIEAWGDRYVELNRGNLRQKHWQEVADTVNARHGHVKKARRTDIQCKNRIDTLKKKYKVEKSKISESNGAYVSSWLFFPRLDALIGPSTQIKKAFPSPVSETPNALPLPSLKFYQALNLTSPIPVAPRSSTVRRTTGPEVVDDSYFRRNFSAFAAAAAAAAEKEGEETEEESSRSRSSMAQSPRKKEEREGGSYRELASAIAKFGKIYEKVEGAKQKQMMELEKQRMQFAKDLEVQRMELLVDMQIQMERVKRAKKNQANGAGESFI